MIAAWLARAVWALDARLRHGHGVGEYTNRPDCILRMQVARNGDDLTLSDGVRLHPGERIIDLHLWNEQFPRMGKIGPTVGWAKRVLGVFDLSLRELARHLACRRDLDDIVAIRVNLGLGAAERRRQLAHIMGRYGFELTPSMAPRSLGERTRRLGENILISLMVWAQNPGAVRRDTLRRDRMVVLVSRRSLDLRYRLDARGTDDRLGAPSAAIPASDAAIPASDGAAA